jgi:hypothetical protein
MIHLHVYGTLRSRDDLLDILWSPSPLVWFFFPDQLTQVAPQMPSTLPLKYFTTSTTISFFPIP